MSQDWNYQEYTASGGAVFIVRDGDRAIAIVKEREHAEMICKAKQDANRTAFEIRKQLMRLKAYKEENRVLVTALRRISDALRKTTPREITNARIELNRALRKVKLTQGGSAR